MKKEILFCILIFLSSIQLLKGQAVLSPDKMLKLVPNRIKGFQQLVDPKAMEMRLSTITYTLCDKKFDDGNRQ